MLDVAFSSLAAALGDEDDPLESIAVPRLLAIAYAVGWSGMLSMNPVDFAGELEAAIDARGGLVDIARWPTRIWRRPRRLPPTRSNLMRSRCTCQCMTPSTLLLTV